MTSQAQPFLRWAGSKRKQIPVLSKFWTPAFKRYVEPFMGSACLFFAIGPRRALLADTNEDLIRTFTAVRDHPTAVANRISKIPRGKRSFYAIRKRQLADMDPLDAAAQFIFLNRFCFNGLFRTNKEGRFNVPYGSARSGQLPGATQLRLASASLRNCEVRESDFEATLARTRRGDFVYLDPPYAVGNRRIFRQYGPSSFGLDDLQRLADSLVALDGRGVKFLLSYAACAEAEDFFGSWSKRQIYIQRNIAGFAAHRRRAGEILFSNCFPEGKALGS